MRTAARLSIMGASLILAACAAGPVAPALKLEACTLPRVPEPVLCGRLPVPENRTEPRRSIELKIVVIPSSGPTRHPPLYDLAGGPGLAATDGADFWAGNPLRASRDIVLVDQRGTGGSAPLPCELSFSNPFKPLLDPAAVATCREHLARDHDLAQYSTAAAVADLEAVRAALGHEQLDLSGLSYGTRMAQEYLRAYPARVRRMALLGTVHPGDKLPLNYSRNAQAVLEQLARHCAADAACRRKVPDLGRDIAKLRQAFAGGPISAKLADGTTVTLEAGPFWEAVRSQLTTTTTQRGLPWLLHEAAAGRYAPILGVLTPRGGPDGFSNGMLLSVVCPEDTLRITETERAQASALPFGDHRLSAQITACGAWGATPLSDPRPGPVRSDIPVLLMAGEMDHVTPVASALDVAATLPNSRVVRIPHLGHFPDGVSNLECYDGLIAAFLNHGDVAGLDVECVKSMKPVPFRMGDKGP